MFLIYGKRKAMLFYKFRIRKTIFLELLYAYKITKLKLYKLNHLYILLAVYTKSKHCN